MVWNVADMVNIDFDSMTLPGHTALDRTDSHQLPDLVIADLNETYECSIIQSTDITSSLQLSPDPVEGVCLIVICISLYIHPFLMHIVGTVQYKRPYC